MSKRGIWSIILIALAVGAMLIERGLIGGLAGSFFLIVMLFLWTFPADTSSKTHPSRRFSLKQVAQVLLGLGLGLIVIVIVALVLPPQAFPWVMLLAGTGLIV
jgi:hypothetical protein